MESRYKHLQAEERVTLASLRQQGWSMRAIAHLQGRSPSTISRELRRNSSDEGYASASAQHQCQQRRLHARPPPKLHPDGDLWFLISTMLCWYCSPQHIARTPKRMHPDNPALHASHESIYTAIYAYPRWELRRQFIALLRQGRSTRRPRAGGADRRGQIPEMVSIHVRPPEVSDRVMPGHWEGDLIKGAGNQSSVGVLVERTTRLVLLCKMANATAESALAAFTAKLNAVAAPLRQFQPKGTDLSVHDQEALDSIADLMNNRPRQTLDWRSPYQAFAQCMAALEDRNSSAIH